MRFSIDAQPVGSELWLCVRGDIDLATAGALDEAIVEELVGRSTGHLIIDLAGVSFLDCSGVGALVRGHTLAEEFRCRYEVRHAAGEPALLLHLLAGALPPMLHSPDCPKDRGRGHGDGDAQKVGPAEGAQEDGDK